MYLACAVVRLVIPESYSLKDRRRVIQSVTATIGRANGAAAVDLSPDRTLNLGVIGLTAISGQLHHAVEIREEALRMLDRDGRFEVLEITTEEMKLEAGHHYAGV